jgi:ribosomal protein S18 acetylase RimI-like enzyme
MRAISAPKSPRRITGYARMFACDWPAPQPDSHPRLDIPACPVIDLISGSDVADLDGVAHSAVPWLIDSGEPYFRRLFADYIAEEVLSWSLRPSSELYLGEARLLLDRGHCCIGGHISMKGPLVVQRRRADAVAYLWERREGIEGERRRRFLDDTASFFGIVPMDAFYLSKIGLLREHRRAGHGRLLLEDVIRLARERNCSSVFLDVAADARAREFYRRYGFEEVTEHINVPYNLHYISMSLSIRA